MSFFRSIIIMMSIYTKIPMPSVEWKEENLKYVLTVFPLSGLYIGLLEAVWMIAGIILRIHEPLYAAIACAVPLLINGGIHLDGLADTADACASHSSPQKRRDILKDPHTGAFGAAAVVIYEILTFGLFSEIFTFKGAGNIWLIPGLMLICFTVPRMMTQIAASVFSPAASEGMLYTLTSAANNRVNLITAVELLAVCTALVWLLQGMAAVVYIVAMLLVFLFFSNMVLRQFEGISGDLCGWLLKVSEVAMLASVIVTLKFL